jgi:hypothetical protein
MQAEEKSELLAAERAEAESRATATVQARMAAEEALARKARDAAEAAQRAAEARRARVEEERALKTAVRARLRAHLARSPWPGMTAAAVAVALLAVATFVLWPDGKEKSPVIAEPLKLRLELDLGSYRP